MNVNFNTYGRQFGARSAFGGLKFGATTARPPVQAFINNGWIAGKLCEAKPKGVSQTGSYQYVDKAGWPDWLQGPYQDAGGAGYIHYKNVQGTDSFWVYSVKSIPCGGDSTSDPSLKITTTGLADVKAVQAALNSKGARDYDGKSLVVDGKVGPRTCSAASLYQSKLGSSAENQLAQWGLLGRTFFDSLGLDGARLEVTIGAMCSTHDPSTGEVLPELPEIIEAEPEPVIAPPSKPKTPAVVVPPVVKEPEEPIQAGFSWKVGLIVASALIGGALLMKSKKLKGKGKGYEKKSSKRKSASKRRR